MTTSPGFLFLSAPPHMTRELLSAPPHMTRERTCGRQGPGIATSLEALLGYARGPAAIPFADIGPGWVLGLACARLATCAFLGNVGGLGDTQTPVATAPSVHRH